MKISNRLIYDALNSNFQRVGVTPVASHADLAKLVNLRPDTVILNAIYIPKKTGKAKTSANMFAQYLDQLGISYVGSNASSLAVGLDKAQSKQAVLKAGLPTASFFTANTGTFNSAADIPINFPLFVKPLSSGNGLGIDEKSVVLNFENYQNKIRAIENEFSSPALVESYLSGREFTVGLIGQGYDEALLAMPVEITTPPNKLGQRLLGELVKSQDSEETSFIADELLFNKLVSLAKRCFKALNGRDYGRIDFRMDSHGKLHFLEANLKPGLGLGYLYRAWQLNTKRSYDSMIQFIVQSSLVRTATELVKLQ